MYRSFLVIFLIILYNSSLSSQIIWDTTKTNPISRKIKPHDLQLYPRNLENKCTIKCYGVLNQIYSGISFVITKTPKNGTITQTLPINAILDGSRHFSFEYEIDAELSNYKIEYRLRINGITVETIILADSVVCGDAYIINGQSNAVANSTNEVEDDQNFGYLATDGYGAFQRSYGFINSVSTQDTWGLARVTGKAAFYVGTWGLYLQNLIVENEQIPVCILNGAVSRSPIIDHLSDSQNAYKENTIFGRLNCRVFKSGLEDGIKAIFWYQGETDVTYTTTRDEYLSRFNSLYNSWHTYFQGYNKTYVIQVHSFIGCSGCKTIHGLQRELPSYFPDLEVMSTNGIQHIIDNIHFNSEGYKNLAIRLYQLLKRDWYCENQNLAAFTPPDIQKIYFNDIDNSLYLEFDQNIDLPDGINTSEVLRTIYIDGTFPASQYPELTGYLDGKVFRISSTTTPWNPNSIIYLTSIPDNEYNGYLRNGDFDTEPATALGALSFYHSIPFYGSGTVTENYIEYPGPPFSTNINYASGLLSGVINSDKKAYEIFNKVPTTNDYAEVPASADITFKSARRIYLNPGFKANYGSRVKMLVGSDIFAFTSENNCGELFENKKSLVSFVQPDELKSYSNNKDIVDSTIIKVYPNPSSDFVNFDYKCSSNNKMVLNIYNCQGLRQLSFTLNPDQSLLTIPVRLFTPGVYIYKVESTLKGILTGKFIIY